MPTPRRFSIPVPRLIRGRSGLFLACEAGAVAVIVAILSPVLIGAMGLGAESGYWYLTQRKLQNAADTAAHGAARSMAGGGDAAAMQQMATYLVEQAAADASVSAHPSPASGPYAGQGNAVEAVVTLTVPRMFTAIYSSEPVPIAARAVALVEPGGTGCVLALSRTAPGAITVSGSSGSTLTQCDMISNAEGEAFVMSGNGASVSANCIQTAGTAVTSANLTVNCEHIRENASPVPDPYADVEEPTPTSVPCDYNNSVSDTVVTPDHTHESAMASHYYCNGLSLKGAVTFEAGLYLIEGGDFTVSANANIVGDGVTFFLAPGVNLRFSGTANLDLSPPTSGPYTGILIFGSRSATTASHLINGNVGSILDGAIYAPASHLEIKGSAKTSENSCTQFVTGTITFTGGGTVNIHCTTPFGATIEVPETVALVE